MRPDLLPDAHSRHVARRARILSGNGHLAPLRMDDLLLAEAEEAANENERDGLIAGFLLLGLLVATFILVGVLGYMLGRAA